MKCVPRSEIRKCNSGGNKARKASAINSAVTLGPATEGQSQALAGAIIRNDQDRNPCGDAGQLEPTFSQLLELLTPRCVGWLSLSQLRLSLNAKLLPRFVGNI